LFGVQHEFAFLIKEHVRPICVVNQQGVRVVHLHSGYRGPIKLFKVCPKPVVAQEVAGLEGNFFNKITSECFENVNRPIDSTNIEQVPLGLLASKGLEVGHVGASLVQQL